MTPTNIGVIGVGSSGNDFNYTSFTSLPSIDAPKESWEYSTLFPNLITEGSTPYTGYETFLWGQTRTGIGTGYVTTIYDVSFVVGSTTTTVSVADGVVATKPTDPVVVGKVFTGVWYKGSIAVGNEFNFTTPIISNTTLVARMVLETDVIDYTFIGWYKDVACTIPWIFATDTVTGPTELYAKWSLTDFTVIFHSNGGTLVTSVIVNLGGLVPVPTPPTRREVPSLV